jgi:hypothetical protein
MKACAKNFTESLNAPAANRRHLLAGAMERPAPGQNGVGHNAHRCAVREQFGNRGHAIGVMRGAIDRHDHQMLVMAKFI